MGHAHSVCDSPRLQDFVSAKKKINNIFMEIEKYVLVTATYMESKYKGELNWIVQGKLEF